MSVHVRYKWHLSFLFSYFDFETVYFKGIGKCRIANAALVRKLRALLEEN